ISALLNHYKVYYATAWNQRLAPLDDPRADVFARQAHDAFRQDSVLVAQYHTLNGDKWDGMMLQTHFGYTGWQQPEKNVMPDVKLLNSNASAKVEFVEPVLPPARPGELSFDAVRFSRARDGKRLKWHTIPNLGPGGGAVTALPQGQASTSQSDGVYL